MYAKWLLQLAWIALLAGCAGVTRYSEAQSIEAQQGPSYHPSQGSALAPAVDSRHSPLTHQEALTHQQFRAADPNGPTSANVFLSMAEMSDRVGNAEHAREMYHRAISIEPANRGALLGLARLEDRLGKFDTAVHYYHEAASRYPHDVPIQNDLALCLARSGQMDSALFVLENVVRQSPDKPRYRNNLAKILVELDRESDALFHLRSVYPVSVAHYNLGVLLADRGEVDGAAAHLNQAVRIDPHMQQAHDLLAEISLHTTSTRQVPQVAAVQQHVSDTSNRYTSPTPMAPSSQLHSSYPTTRTPAEMPTSRLLPGETTQVPVGHSPVHLPTLH